MAGAIIYSSPLLFSSRVIDLPQLILLHLSSPDPKHRPSQAAIASLALQQGTDLSPPEQAALPHRFISPMQFLPGKSIPRLRDVLVANPCALPLPLPMTIIAAGRASASLAEGRGGGEGRGRSRGLSWLGGVGVGVPVEVFTDYIM